MIYMWYIIVCVENCLYGGTGNVRSDQSVLVLNYFVIIVIVSLPSAKVTRPLEKQEKDIERGGSNRCEISVSPCNFPTVSEREKSDVHERTSEQTQADMGPTSRRIERKETLKNWFFLSPRWSGAAPGPHLRLRFFTSRRREREKETFDRILNFSDATQRRAQSKN